MTKFNAFTEYPNEQVHVGQENMFKANQINDERSYSLDAERKSKMQEKIYLALKEIMYNSVAQAILKIFHTPYLALKLCLTIFVLLTISIR